MSARLWSSARRKDVSACLRISRAPQGAVQRLNWTEIPAIVRADVDDRTLVRPALPENPARTDLDPLEEAEGYRAL
jgi:hypothetical protein